MALSTYAQLVSAVRDWLARSGDTANLPDERVDEFIRMAEADIYAKLRVRQMEATAALNVNAQSVALPADFIEARRLFLVDDPRIWLEYLSPPQFWREHSSQTTGRPRVYTVEATNVVFGPAPDATYSGSLVYYKRPATLSTEVAALFTDFPELFLFGALVNAGAFIGEDERLGTWRGFYAEALARAQQQSDRAVSGAPLTMRVG